MDQLPALETSTGLYALPLAEETAVGLVDILLETDDAQRQRQITSLLLDDPTLALWTLFGAQRGLGEAPRTIKPLAQWLSASALDVLHWPEEASGAAAREAPPPSCRYVLQENSSGDAEQAEQGYLEALLREAAAWPADEPPGEIEQRPSSGHRGGRILRQLVRRLRRLEQLDGDFQRALETEKLASLKELAYGASHEINNPLANISTRAQTLLRDEADPQRRQKLAVINAQAFRAHEMISDLMLFARPPEIELERVDLAEVVSDVCGELAARAEEQSTALNTSNIARDQQVVTGDGTQLRVALKALVQNSLEAICAGGQIDISLSGPVAGNDSASGNGHGAAPSFRIVVADNGPGITPEVRRHLFDPFYSGREAGRGLGFGLSKCWRIVTSHGGQIHVGSEPGRGATFTVLLPAAARPKEKVKR
jgi:signal transduction histidine kinase